MSFDIPHGVCRDGHGEPGGPQAFWLGSTYDISCVNVDGQWLFKVMAIDSRLWAPHATGWNEEGK